MTTLERELGRKPSFDEVREAMSRGFATAFGIDLVDGELTREKFELAAQLRPKYASEEWLKKR